jgi:hypothetical protein
VPGGGSTNAPVAGSRYTRIAPGAAGAGTVGAGDRGASASRPAQAAPASSNEAASGHVGNRREPGP